MLHRQKARVRKTVLKLLVPSAASRVETEEATASAPARRSSVRRRRRGRNVIANAPSGGRAAAMSLAATSLAVIGPTAIGRGRRAERQRARRHSRATPREEPPRPGRASASDRNVRQRGQRSAAPKAPTSAPAGGFADNVPAFLRRPTRARKGPQRIVFPSPGPLPIPQRCFISTLLPKEFHSPIHSFADCVCAVRSSARFSARRNGTAQIGVKHLPQRSIVFLWINPPLPNFFIGEDYGSPCVWRHPTMQHHRLPLTPPQRQPRDLGPEDDLDPLWLRSTKSSSAASRARC